MSGIFFLADTHFGHQRVIEFEEARKHFATIEEHDETLIENWNKKVGRKDTVYHLGDFSCGPHPPAHYRNRLNGKVILIRGNHDQKITKLRSCMEVFDTKFLKGPKIWLCHYPCYEWPASHHGSYHLFGHVHENYQRVPIWDDGVGGMIKNSNTFNVGVCWAEDLAPFALEELPWFTNSK